MTGVATVTRRLRRGRVFNFRAAGLSNSEVRDRLFGMAAQAAACICRTRSLQGHNILKCASRFRLNFPGASLSMCRAGFFLAFRDERLHCVITAT
jgi:hypothetical protein